MTLNITSAPSFPRTLYAVLPSIRTLVSVSPSTCDCAFIPGVFVHKGIQSEQCITLIRITPHQHQ